ncbi:MAG: hypothetical protein ABR585_05810 [Gemmatimonadaceae bacterium]
MRAFSFPSIQLPVRGKEQDLADRIALVSDIGFVFLLREREQKIPAKAGEIEKWISNQVVRRGAKQIQNTCDLLHSYVGLSVVNGFGHRVAISPRLAEDFIRIIVYRVPARSRSFRAARFKRTGDGGFVHVLRDDDYFEVCSHFVTPTELHDYFEFRREILVNWDPPATGVSEEALIGQYLLDDLGSPPDSKFERAALSRGGPTACEFSFVMDSLAADISSQESDFADTDGYHSLVEVGRLARPELRALKQQLRLTLEAVRGDRFELPYRVVSQERSCAFLLVPVTSEFRERAFDALASLSLASKHELQLEKQVGIGMWRSGEFVDIEWIFIEAANLPNPALDERLRRHYPFRRTSEKRLPPIFL